MLLCLWLCFHERLPTLLLDQKTGDGKGTQGIGRTRKRREGDTEQGFLQVAPGSRTPVRAVGGKRVVRLLLIPACCSTWLSQARGWEWFTVPYCSVSQQPTLYGFVLCVGASLSVLLMGLQQPD